MPHSIAITKTQCLTCIHGKELVVTEKFGDIFLIFSQDVVVESSGSESEFLCLVDQRPNDLGVAVALVDGGVGTQEVEVPLALHVPYEHTCKYVEG